MCPSASQPSSAGKKQDVVFTNTRRKLEIAENHAKRTQQQPAVIPDALPGKIMVTAATVGMVPMKSFVNARNMRGPNAVMNKSATVPMPYEEAWQSLTKAASDIKSLVQLVKKASQKKRRDAVSAQLRCEPGAVLDGIQEVDDVLAEEASDTLTDSSRVSSNFDELSPASTLNLDDTYHSDISFATPGREAPATGFGGSAPDLLALEQSSKDGILISLKRKLKYKSAK